VSAEAEGGVDDDGTWRLDGWREQFDAALEHDRDVESIVHGFGGVIPADPIPIRRFRTSGK
jgi:hypothetical protein